MQKLIISPIVHLEITSGCDTNCPGCWGPPKEIGNRPLNDFKQAIKKLKSFGLVRIILTGGEPTLVPKIDEFIKYTKEELCLDVVLQTNGAKMVELMSKVAQYIDMVAISLEASRPEIDFRRGKKGFERSVASIKYILEKYPQIKLKIGTCVFKQNFDDLENIGNLLLGLNYEKKIKENESIWKLYQIRRLGKGKNDPILDTMLIKTPYFNKKVDELKKKFSGKIKITREANDTVNPEIIVRPNGEVIITANEKDKNEILAQHNLFDDFNATLKDILIAQNREKDSEKIEEYSEAQ
jgi:MoaA/NifB/PqqE/SkfB family radical SAM enzyme